MIGHITTVRALKRPRKLTVLVSWWGWRLRAGWILLRRSVSKSHRHDAELSLPSEIRPLDWLVLFRNVNDEDEKGLQICAIHEWMIKCAEQDREGSMLIAIGGKWCRLVPTSPTLCSFKMMDCFILRRIIVISWDELYTDLSLSCRAWITYHQYICDATTVHQT